MLCGCRQWFLDDADREVARLIESRQRAAIGGTSNADLRTSVDDVSSTPDMYRMVPSPVDSTVPAPFLAATTPPRAPESTDASQNNSTPSASEPSDAAEPNQAGDEIHAEPPEPFTLSDALAFAMAHARRYQTEKELLYLSALDLTLEQYLWTPRFVESALSLGYTNFGQIGRTNTVGVKDEGGRQDSFDQALEAVSNFAVEQRLPYGGEVTARVLDSLIRDLNSGVTTGESGQLILESRIPLLRGAGRVAYESRYQAERNLVYAVRAFEHFRREFLVSLATDYFNLLEAKANIESAEAQAASLTEDYKRDKAFLEVEQILPVEADRTRVGMLNAQNAAVIAREEYATALDFFKVRIGMSPSRAVDVVEEEVELIDPAVQAALAIETALKYRLDLRTVADRVEDSRRQVQIARNNILPQVDLSGSVAMDTEPGRPNTFGYNTERTTWKAGVNVEVPLERKAERNAYRSSLIRLRQAQRDFEETADNVRLEVQRAIRRISRAQASMDIQAENIRVNEARADMARTKFALGELASNRDVVEAEDDLRNARNDYANAVSEFRSAILEFLRDTGTLRVGDDGKWVSYDTIAGAGPSDAAPSADRPPPPDN